MVRVGRQATFYSCYSSPIGELLLTSDGEALTGLRMSVHRGQPAKGPDPSWQRNEPWFRTIHDQLDAYFQGKRRDFEFPMRMEGTPFQRLVWEGLRTIPFGSTMSYAELATRIGRPGASRAVGSANGRNPIAIIVPCHRVIAADGTLGGFGGGLDRKEWLLEHEGASSREECENRQPQRRVTRSAVGAVRR